MSGVSLAEAYAATAAPFPFRVHQKRALTEIDQLMVNGERRRAWVVLPPGTGKTLVGLETVRRLGAKAVVLGPNTAIQSQWVRQWQAFTPATVGVGTDRSLSTPVTALTYQSLATFDADAEMDEEGHELVRPGTTRRRGPLLDRLHPNGVALVEALRKTEPLTIVLDECHHLLEVWGRLVAELLDLVPHAYVLGLTATPPHSLTKDQVKLVDELFGPPVYGTSIPSVVREGHLAPFAELAWLTTPTAAESDWLAAQAERFRELTTDLTDPTYGEIPFLVWLDRRFVARRPPARDGERLGGDALHGAGARIGWDRLERDEPELTAAALRLHHAGLLDLPDGARIREEHRFPPTADDWVRLIDDWVRHCLLASEHPGDQAVLAGLRRALPSVGYTLTKRGIRAGRSPVDRVLARSQAKTHGAVEIVAAEQQHLRDRMRTLILCDHEHASATLPATLRGVLAAEAGSARLMLESLEADSRTARLAPMLVTGRTVAAGPETAEAFVAYIRRTQPDLDLAAGEPDAAGIAEVTGRWSSRTWVPLVTSYFERGSCQVLVGTRGLLGEGWDARCVSGLVDLTTAATPTAVVQTRGRALRTDPSWPDKVAVTWTVVCVTEDHPKGNADWDRFVRKHDGYFGIDETGEIVDGIAAVDHSFSPYAPPKSTEFDAVNAGQLVRAAGRHRIRELWQVGTAYEDRPVHTVRIRRRARADREAETSLADTGRAETSLADTGRASAGHAPGSQAPSQAGASQDPNPPAALPVPAPPAMPAAGGGYPIAVAAPNGVTRTDARPLPARISSSNLALSPAALALAATLYVLGVWPAAAGLIALAGVALGAYQLRAVRSAGALVVAAAQPVDPLRIAYAVADGLHACGVTPVGAAAVTARVDAGGEYRIALDGVDAAQSRDFVLALDEALSPMASPRYVIPRYVLASPAGPRERFRAAYALLQDRLRPAEVVWHAVPATLGSNAERAAAYAAAWRRWVSDGDPLYTGSPEGGGILAAHRGVDPMDATTVLRLTWH